MMSEEVVCRKRRLSSFQIIILGFAGVILLGALLLAGLYALFGDVVMPTLNQRIKDMFNYAGALGG